MRVISNVWEKSVANSKLAGVVGKTSSCKLKISRKKMVKILIKFLFRIKNKEKNQIGYLKKQLIMGIKGK